MGQRHNRRRTRSRPRNRVPFQNNMYISQFDQTTPVPPAFPPPAFSPFTTSWSSTLVTHQKHQHHPRPLNYLETQTLRIFGGEAGDGQILCAPMLKVVMDLFNDIDYVDP
ncbi:uncharacterized protein IWZ02DRAFT_488843 [Phyllosticta citriasiana]|uniref:Uncharacterized protein n=1 Tax=Phyllosticta citriasiana TaxID=595635 RepID=A0ABR1KMB8_9PEZI